MSEHKVYRAIGLMSGTSLDGEIDVALIETDGKGYAEALDFYSYECAGRKNLEIIRGCFGKPARDKRAEEIVTDLHIQAVKGSGFEADIIGFHGQTVFHAPDRGITVQLGDGARLARETGIDVVCDMRQEDVKAGGQGAPLLPLYHAARVRAAGLEGPLAIYNIGGVSNVTYIEANGDVRCAFDCGPGNALMDDFMRLRTGHAFDRAGMLAAAGHVHEDIVEAAYLEREGFFYQSPPKSLDRDDFAYVSDMVSGLSTEDGLATLMAFTVRAMDEAERFGSGALACYVCGGGRHNKALMQALDGALPGGARAVEALGWNGDATEAEGFAYLAVRSMLGLPLTLPETTGVAEPQTGGVYHSHD